MRTAGSAQFQQRQQSSQASCRPPETKSARRCSGEQSPGAVSAKLAERLTSIIELW
jgi:hypothetical protein